MFPPYTPRKTNRTVETQTLFKMLMFRCHVDLLKDILLSINYSYECMCIHIWINILQKYFIIYQCLHIYVYIYILYIMYLYIAIAMLPSQTFSWSQLSPATPNQHLSCLFTHSGTTWGRTPSTSLDPVRQKQLGSNGGVFHVQFRLKEYCNCQVIMIACIIT